MIGRRAAAVALALGALALAAGCGGSGSGGGRGLAWAQGPRLLAPPTLPHDRILTGQVRNDTVRTLEVKAGDVRLVDRRGRSVPGKAIFLQQFKHRLPPFNRNDPVAPREQRLSGFVAHLRPGQRVPMTVSWHQPRGGAVPVRVELGGGSLPIPG